MVPALFIRLFPRLPVPSLSKDDFRSSKLDRNSETPFQQIVWCGVYLSLLWCCRGVVRRGAWLRLRTPGVFGDSNVQIFWC